MPAQPLEEMVGNAIGIFPGSDRVFDDELIHFVQFGVVAVVEQPVRPCGRDALDAGCLSLYVAQRAGRLRLLQLGLRALFGRLRQARDFEATIASEIVIESRRHRLRVATDGEVTTLQPPLRYRVLPRALHVIRPARPA